MCRVRIMSSRDIRTPESTRLPWDTLETHSTREPHCAVSSRHRQRIFCRIQQRMTCVWQGIEAGEIVLAVPSELTISSLTARGSVQASFLRYEVVAEER